MVQTSYLVPHENDHKPTSNPSDLKTSRSPTQSQSSQKSTTALPVVGDAHALASARISDKVTSGLGQNIKDKVRKNLEQKDKTQDENDKNGSSTKSNGSSAEDGNKNKQDKTTENSIKDNEQVSQPKQTQRSKRSIKLKS